jgi:hypothetical protein
MVPIRILTSMTLVLALFAGAQQTAPEAPLRPDPAFQAGISRLLAAQSPEEQRVALAALEAGAGPEHRSLVQQLFLFTLAATDTREAMVLGVVLKRLDVPEAHVVGALVPLLESGDAGERAALGNVLSEYEHLSVERGADFSVYRPLLEQGLAPGLVRHLFETDPDAALLAVLRVQVSDLAELRSILWAEHEVADAVWKLRFGFVAREEAAQGAPEALAQLDFLAGHPRWWARLYAARIGNLEPALAVRVEELRKDEHALVREAAGAGR